MFLNEFHDSHVGPDSISQPASYTFTLRRWVIWKDSCLVHALLLLLALGQWILMMIRTGTSSQSFFRLTPSFFRNVDESRDDQYTRCL
jgi:hypothetical protein